MNVSLQIFGKGNGMLRRREVLQDCFRVANFLLTKTGEVLMSDHNVHKKSQKVTLLSLHWCLAVHDPTACRRRERAYVLVRQCLIGCIAGSIPRKKDKGQHTEHSTKSDLWFSLRSFELLMSEICFTSFWNTWIGSLTPQISKILESRTVCSYCICWPSGRKHHLFFAMLRWILLPLAVAMSDDAECDSPGMMQLKGVPSHQGNQPRGRRKFTPDVWAPKFETSNNQTSTTLQMACQGVAWFTLMICDNRVVGSLASPTL